MKNFFTRIFRFFWSWGFLKFVLGVFLLLILLYVEENWRGAHTWAVTKAKWEAQGESFDPNTYYPKPVPDAQNLAALPLFALEPEPASDFSAVNLKSPKPAYLSPLKLRDALNEEKHGGALPRVNKSLDEIHAGVATAFAKVFPGVKPPASPLAQFEALYPLIPEIRQAAAERPLCRFNQDYSILTPFRGLELIVAPIGLGKKFALDAVLAMGENQPQVALADFRVNFRCATAVGRDPTLVGGLVEIGTVAITRGVIDDFLQKHAFTDPQLVELQHEFKTFDFVAHYPSTMRGEIVTGTIPAYDFNKSTVVFEDSILAWPRALPDGWMDLNKAQLVDFIFQQVKCSDPQQHRIFPEQDLQLQDQLEKMRSGISKWMPWNLFFAVTAGPISNALKKFAEIQAWIDQDQIACALERYHLAHGVYPNTLAELAPTYIDALPHDIMNGEAYHYRLQPDGTFLLYSVGWNQTDDGGKIVYQTDSKMPDYEQGDWPWPTSK